MKEIIKYKNRKLYDKELNKSITLQDIVKYLANGEQLQVLDHESGINITNTVLKNALHYVYLDANVLTGLFKQEIKKC